MKKLIFLMTALLFLSFSKGETYVTEPVQISAELSDLNDKEYLLNYFRETEQNLQNSVVGLTEAQMTFKPSEEAWSISQCLEHIIRTEDMLFGMAKETMGKPANPNRKNEVKLTPEELIAEVRDRSKKVQAPQELQVPGKYKGPETAMNEFEAQRQLVLEYIETTPVEEMRNHISDSPFGPVDGYHSIMYIAGHTDRHTLQIEEIKQAEGFPQQ